MRSTLAEESMDELVQLAVSAGAEVQARLLQSRETADAATLIGSGKVGNSLRWWRHPKPIRSSSTGLSSTQQRNLEKRLGVKVLTPHPVDPGHFRQRARGLARDACRWNSLN